MRDAIALATDPANTTWGVNRVVWNIPEVPRNALAYTTNESVCRAAAEAYARLTVLEGETVRLRPVLVIQIGDKYLVDDLRSRRGPYPNWEVAVFDRDWQIVASYGGGA